MKKNYSKKTKKSFLFLVLLCLVSFNTYSDDFYVDGAVVGGTNDGSSWANAFLTIQEAVDATAGGTTSNNIFVKEGIYTGATTAVAYGPTNKFISMFGGYDSVDATLDVVNNPTIIDGQNSLVGVWARNLFTLDGFTVRNGYRLQTAGSGVMSFSASNRALTIRNCIIENNQVAVGSSSTSDVRGGGVFANACEVIIENSTIQNNVARTSTGAVNAVSALGGGIYAVNTITITNSTISGNEARSYQAVSPVSGGGIYTTGQVVNVTGSSFTGNFTNYQNGVTITKREFENVLINFTGVNTLEATTVDATSTVTVNAGATLNVTNSIINDGTISGDLTYNVNVADTNWHLVSSPLVGAAYNDAWIIDNDIASGGSFTNNRGISTYDNSSLTTPAVAGASDHWRYTQGGDNGTFGTGVGYALIKDANPGVSSGNYTFTGTMPTTVSPGITQGVSSNNWNMVGNSFPSYMDVAAFITANTALLTGPSQAIHVWNGTAYVPLTTGYVQPGQAFFVDAASPGTISVTKAMQSHQDPTTNVFYKSSTPTLNLSLKDGANTRSTQINYFNNKTNGLDPGFDIRAFDGVTSNFSLTTQLIEEYQNLGFARQALPTSGMESTIIPIGLNAAAGKEITFSVEALNLPNGIEVYLEDRAASSFTSLTDGDVKVVLNEAANGTGKYYLHLSAKALSIDTNVLESISVYTSSKTNLRVVGLPNANATVKLFNVLGKQVLNKTFKASNSVQNISLPNLARGVYVVKIESENSKLNKKIILE